MAGNRTRRPKIVAITNESPDWSPLDIQYADETWSLLLEAFDEAGFTYRSIKFFDDLSGLDEFDPHEWLVWNGGEEWEGKPWSEAEVAEHLERRGFAYTGAPASVLRTTQSRLWIKEELRAAGLPTLPYCVCRRAKDAQRWSTFPAIVKGLNQHASVGIDRESVVFENDELARRVQYLREQYDDDALVEPFLDSREFQVAVIGNSPPEALPPSEMVYTMFNDIRDRLHTQSWKVDRESRGFREIKMPCPAPEDRPDWQEKIQSIAVLAYAALGLRDYARFDMRMLGDEPQILDVNTNPELDPESVVLSGAKARGMSAAQMFTRIVECAAQRMPARRPARSRVTRSRTPTSVPRKGSVRRGM